MQKGSTENNLLTILDISEVHIILLDCLLAVICSGWVTTFYCDTLSCGITYRMPINFFFLPKFSNLTRSVLIISCFTRCPTVIALKHGNLEIRTCSKWTYRWDRLLKIWTNDSLPGWTTDNSFCLFKFLFIFFFFFFTSNTPGSFRQVFEIKKCAIF